MTARRVDRPLVPVGQLRRRSPRRIDVKRRRPRCSARALPPAAQPVPSTRPPDAGLLGALVRLPAERIEDEIPGADVADLAAAEPGLEVGDPAGREAPQVVARGALLAGRPDRLPLQEVVRPALAAVGGHPAVRLDDAGPAPDEEQGRRPLRRRAAGEQQPGAAGRARRPPRCRGRPARSGSGSRPGRPSRGRPGRTRAARSPSASRHGDPAVRALLTYCRHFLRRSPQSASSSAARSMIRVAFGWIGSAGRQPAARRRVADRAVRGRAAHRASISGSIRRWAIRSAARPQRPPGRLREGADRRPAVQRRGHGAARGVGERPRQGPRPPEQDLRPPTGLGPRFGVASARIRSAPQPLTAFTRAQPRQLEIRARVGRRPRTRPSASPARDPTRPPRRVASGASPVEPAAARRSCGHARAAGGGGRA